MGCTRKASRFDADCTSILLARAVATMHDKKHRPAFRRQDLLQTSLVAAVRYWLVRFLVALRCVSSCGPEQVVQVEIMGAAPPFMSTFGDVQFPGVPGLCLLLDVRNSVGTLG